MKQFQLRDGIFEAIIDRFYKDASLIAYGEENRDWGGAFAVYRGLTEALPYHRLFNAPIAEAAIIGTAIGYAMCGGRVIPRSCTATSSAAAATRCSTSCPNGRP